MSDKVQITIKNKVGEKYADLQTKIVTPSKETQIITADDGYYGLREVIVGANAIDGDLLANEINSMKESITEGDATPEDIALGKIAYVNGEKVVGTYKNPTTLKKLLDYTGSCKNMFNGHKFITDLTGYIAYEDTSNVTDTSIMFDSCSSLTTIPLFDTRNVTDMSYMFSSCIELTTIPLLDTSNVTNMTQMFYRCTKLTTIPLLDTSNVTNMSYMFDSCTKLTTIPLLDISNVTYITQMFYNCTKLTNLKLLNIKINLQVGSGSNWGHLLTLESLLGLCQECVNVNVSRKLTVGTANINKLADVYVKLTGEPEEDETLPKLPMVQCESTDEGAMTITQYMAEKNWSLA